MAPFTRMGPDVSDKTLPLGSYVGMLARTDKAENDFLVKVLNFFEDLSEKCNYEGVPMYGPLAVGSCHFVSRSIDRVAWSALECVGVGCK